MIDCCIPILRIPQQLYIYTCSLCRPAAAAVLAAATEIPFVLYSFVFTADYRWDRLDQMQRIDDRFAWGTSTISRFVSDSLRDCPPDGASRKSNGLKWTIYIYKPRRILAEFDSNKSSARASGLYYYRATNHSIGSGHVTQSAPYSCVLRALATYCAERFEQSAWDKSPKRRSSSIFARRPVDKGDFRLSSRRKKSQAVVASCIRQQFLRINLDWWID